MPRPDPHTPLTRPETPARACWCRKRTRRQRVEECVVLGLGLLFATAAIVAVAYGIDRFIWWLKMHGNG